MHSTDDGGLGGMKWKTEWRGDANFRDICVPTLIWNNPFFFPLMMNGAGNNSHSHPKTVSVYPFRSEDFGSTRCFFHRDSHCWEIS